MYTTTMLNKYLNPKTDFSFKKIFGTTKNQDILIAMLNAVLANQLHRPIKSVVFLTTFQDPEVAKKKQSIVDVLCQDSDGCQYIIEMQVPDAEGFQERAQYYAAKAFISQLAAGKNYLHLKKVIFLAFVDFTLFPQKTAYKSEHMTLDSKSLAHDLDKMSFTFVELPKFSKTNTTPIEELSLEEKFYYFLHHAPEMEEAAVQTLVGKDAIIGKAFQALNRFFCTEAELQRYEAEEKRDRDHRAILAKANHQGKEKGLQQGLQKGRKEGLQKGRKEGEQVGLQRGLQKGRKEGEQVGLEKGRWAEKLALARKLMAKGMDQHMIQELTGLSLSEFAGL